MNYLAYLAKAYPTCIYASGLVETLPCVLETKIPRYGHLGEPNHAKEWTRQQTKAL